MTTNRSTKAVATRADSYRLARNPAKCIEEAFTEKPGALRTNTSVDLTVLRNASLVSSSREGRASAYKVEQRALRVLFEFLAEAVGKVNTISTLSSVCEFSFALNRPVEQDCEDETGILKASNTMRFVGFEIDPFPSAHPTLAALCFDVHRALDAEKRYRTGDLVSRNVIAGTNHQMDGLETLGLYDGGRFCFWIGGRRNSCDLTAAEWVKAI